MRKKKEKVDEYGNPVEKNALGTAFTVLMALISAAIFLVIFLRIFQTRDSEISNQIIMDSRVYRMYCAESLQVKLPETPGLFQPSVKSRFVCQSVHPSTTMNTEGRIQVREVYHMDSADTLLMTLRLNTRYFEKDKGLGYDFVLQLIDNRDGSCVYTQKNYQKTDVRSGYTFLRIAFTEADLTENVTARLLVLPKGGDPKGSNYLNLKLYGSDIYMQEEAPKRELVEYLPAV